MPTVVLLAVGTLTMTGNWMWLRCIRKNLIKMHFWLNQKQQIFIAQGIYVRGVRVYARILHTILKTKLNSTFFVYWFWCIAYENSFFFITCCVMNLFFYWIKEQSVATLNGIYSSLQHFRSNLTFRFRSLGVASAVEQFLYPPYGSAAFNKRCYGMVATLNRALVWN